MTDKPDRVDYKKSVTDPLTVHEIAEFGMPRNMFGECQVCGTNSWTVSLPDNKRLRTGIQTYQVDTEVDLSAGLFLETLRMYCKNCGYVREHVAHVIKEAVRGGGKT